MNTDTIESTTIKDLVREKYGEIARGDGGCGCCGTNVPVSMIGDAYDGVAGHVPDADLGLGCGLPTEHAGLAPGQTVLDLGSGAGNDVFIAREEVGAEGRVIGVDFTDAMIEKARRNNERMGFTNVEFRQGEIEALPVENNSVDVVISNCVLNLVPDKARAFAEIHRVLKPGAHFCISDIVLDGVLPEKLAKAAEYYVGCVAGALQKSDYLGIVEKQGFTGLEIRKERAIDIPDDALLEVLTPEEAEAFRASGVAILSITLRAQKPECNCSCC